MRVPGGADAVIAAQVVRLLEVQAAEPEHYLIHVSRLASPRDPAEEGS